MPTPSKHDLKASRIAGSIVKAALELEKEYGEQIEALDNAAETGLPPVKAKTRSVRNKINDILALSEGILKVYSSASKSVQTELELGLSNGTRKIDLDSITVDTDLLNEAPKLCAKFGRKRANEMLLRAFPNKCDRIDGYRFCKCFGFTGSECHFVDFFRDWAKEMHGVLVYGTPFKGYVWTDCKNFLDIYYDKYYVKQAKGLYVARSSRNIKFLYDVENKRRV